LYLVLNYPVKFNTIFVHVVYHVLKHVKKFYIVWSIDHLSPRNGIRNNKIDYTSREEQIFVKNK